MTEPSKPSESQTTQQLDENDDTEPLLKYSRLGYDLKKVLKTDPASCLTLHEKFLVVGTHSGTIHVFDHEGNKVRIEFKTHDITVNQISLDERADYLASCCDSGKVMIRGLFDTEHDQSIEFERPVKAVAISPFYSKSQHKFVTGDDKLVLTEIASGLFGKRNKSTILSHENGMIKTIKWRTQYVAWANEKEVKVYDISSKEKIALVKFDFKDHNKERPDLYKCSLCWKDENTLLIAWGNMVKICSITARDPRTSNQNHQLPSKQVNIVSWFETDYYICGIAPSDGNDIVLLTYSDSEVVKKDDGKTIVNPRPHVRLIEPANGHSCEKSNDALGLRDYEKMWCYLYGLEWVEGEQTLFIVSPSDVIVAKPRTEDDHVAWLVKHHKYEEAMDVVQREKAKIKSTNFEEIGHKYLEYLLLEKDYEQAAGRLPAVLGDNKENWETYFYKFQEFDQVQVVAPYLPTDKPRLSPAIYELVLYYALKSNITRFASLLEEWNHTLYETQTIIKAVLDYFKYPPHPISDEDHRTLCKSLAVLYTNQRNYDEALSVYIRLKHEDVFPFIHKHNLFKSIDNKIITLMEFDTQKTLDLLINNLGCISPQTVVQQLDKDAQHHQYLYLDRLYSKYPQECHKYHMKLVYLYAEHDRKKLLPFLKRADGYDQNIAMKFCDERHYIPEKAFLLGKLGNHRQALELIIQELKDVEYAIEFCKEHNYQSLWDQLISYSIDKPNFVRGLLNNIGTHVDPLVLINRIKEDMNIPGLRDSLVKILSDYNLQISVRKHCEKILRTDVYNLLQKRITSQQKALSVTDNQKCVICKELIIPRDLRLLGSNLVLFYCHHAFHQDCLPDAHTMTCNVCNAQRRTQPSTPAYLP